MKPLPSVPALLLFITTLWLPSRELPGQTPLSNRYYQGYQKALRGGGFQYHSPEPGVNTSLLIRSLDSAQYIEWSTETVPSDQPGDRVNLIWMFGIDANADSHRFRLMVNGQELLSFRNPVVSSMQPWQEKGTGGATLTFTPTLLDKYNDPMGYAILSLPASLVRAGSPQVIRITGESAGSRSWYMTFEAGVSEKRSVAQVPGLARGEKMNYIPVQFRFVHTGDSAGALLEAEGIPDIRFTLKTGYTEVLAMMPENTSPGTKTARILVGTLPPDTLRFNLAPVRKFTVYLVQHTHTDIGYTRPQTEILPDHLRYIDYALDFCDQTDSLPEEARFRWTCETSWAVREFLRTRPPQQLERLKRRVREGRIELTALFLNGSDLSDEASVAASLQPVAEFRRQGFPVVSAMQSDINGVPWCLADYLPGAGIRYLTMAQNTHRALKPFDGPTPFWWESPSGNRILVNRPEHYMAGNMLGILTGRETLETELFRHLAGIEKQGYPFETYSLQFSGYLTDNSPPSTTACQTVRDWNQRWVWPRLRLATVSEYLERIAGLHSAELPVLKGAWPDWWMDGFGSAPITTAHARSAHADYLANNGLITLAMLLGDPVPPGIGALQDEITDDLLFYDEHTFGAAESISDPLSENSVVQEAQKLSYAWSAVKKNRLVREQVMGLIQPRVARDTVPVIVLFNTLARPRTGEVPVYIDHQLMPRSRPFRIVDEAGRPMPFQALAEREEGTWWMLHADYIPPFGFATFRILPDTAGSPSPDGLITGRMENRHYLLTFDTVRGRIVGIFDKALGRELTGTDPLYPPGEVILERLGKNRAQLEQKRLEEYSRTSWNHPRFGRVKNGPVWQSVNLTANLEGCAEPGVTCEIRLYHKEKKLEFLYSLRKLSYTDPEGIYVSFPFDLPGGQLWFESTGGPAKSGSGQLEGSSTDWTGIQNFVSLRGKAGQIVFCSPEIPLVQPGGLNLGRFHRNPGKPGDPPFPASGNLYSWVMNNYWTTNFLSRQEGELKWRYLLTSDADTSLALAANFGMENRLPVLYRVFPAAPVKETRPGPRSFFLLPDNLALVVARPAREGRAILLQIRETNGTGGRLPVYDVVSSGSTLAMAGMIRAVTEVNALEDPAGTSWERPGPRTTGYRPCSIDFKPFETKFIRIDLQPVP